MTDMRCKSAEVQHFPVDDDDDDDDDEDDDDDDVYDLFPT